MSNLEKAIDFAKYVAVMIVVPSYLVCIQSPKTEIIVFELGCVILCLIVIAYAELLDSCSFGDV